MMSYITIYPLSSFKANEIYSYLQIIKTLRLNISNFINYKTNPFIVFQVLLFSITNMGSVSFQDCATKTSFLTTTTLTCSFLFLLWTVALPLLPDEVDNFKARFHDPMYGVFVLVVSQVALVLFLGELKIQ